MAEDRTRNIHALSVWTAEFRHRDTEDAFRRENEVQTARHTNIALLISGVLFFAFSYSDYVSPYVSLPMWGLLLAGRTLSLLLALAAVLALRRRPHLACTGWPITLVEIFALGVFMCVAVVRSQELAWDTVSMIILVLGVYLLVPNRFILASGVAWLATLAYVLCLLLIFRPELVVRITLALQLLVAQAIGMFAAYRISVLRRNGFRRLSVERAYNRKMRDEIEARRQLEIRLKTYATTDPLTGILNRRQFMELSGRAVNEAMRAGQPVSVLFMDLDRFKSINDRFGHATGDEVLKHVATACGSVLREVDLFGRLGGEEFAATLPGVEEAEALRVARRLQRQLLGNEAGTPELDNETVTMCVGVAKCRSVAAPLEDALRRADAALYEGKREGGNRVVLAGAAEATTEPAPTA